jgi:hypothetical protein
LNAQNNSINLEKTEYINKLDASKIAERHFPNSQLIRKTPKWNYGREYVYKLNNENAHIYITIGLYKSDSSAFEVANQYLNIISMRMNEGLKQENIGDKFWWWSVNNEIRAITSIVFIRKNALIILGSQNYSGLLNLAKLIDEDISKNEPFISMDAIIETPKIHSITRNADKTNPLEFTKFSVDASDINNEILDFQFFPGLTNFENDPNNVFTYINAKHDIENNAMKHKIKIIAINENNVVSEITLFDIDFY